MGWIDQRSFRKLNGVSKCQNGSERSLDVEGDQGSSSDVLVHAHRRRFKDGALERTRKITGRDGRTKDVNEGRSTSREV